MKDLSTYNIIGNISEDMLEGTQFTNLGIVYAAPGILKHINKHKTKFSQKEKDELIETMKEIFNNPDYMGEHPQKIGKSLEIIKKIDNNLLLSIEIDKKFEYNYVSSMYVITEAKLNKRIQNNRVTKIDRYRTIDKEVAIDTV